jgi:hypothetical protein
MLRTDIFTVNSAVAATKLERQLQQTSLLEMVKLLLPARDTTAIAGDD